MAAAPDEYQATREVFLEQINAVRAAAGVRALRLSAALSDAAQGLADEEASAAPGAAGSSPEEGARRAARAGYDTKFISEVVAEADGDVAEVVTGLRNGGGTPATEIVGPNHRDLGLGAAIRNDRSLYVLLFGVSWDDFFHEHTDPLKNLEAMRERMLARVNKERTGKNLAPLRRHPTLDKVAQAHADDMFARRYYAHDTPEGKTVMDRIQAKGYRAKFSGENIARGQYSIDEVMVAWMLSPKHQEHLLSPTYPDVGFGLAFGKTPDGYTILWVQDFARPKGRERL